MPPLRIHERVVQEFNTARAWYADRSQVAAENSTRRFDDAKGRVRLRPTSHALWRAGFRWARLVQFPYLLISHLVWRQVSVLALVHARRDASHVLPTIRPRMEDID